MLENRVSPILLVKNEELYKSKRFDDFIYIGDPFNAVRLFNEYGADEVLIYDISDFTNEVINFSFLDHLARYSTCPLGYGGGITSVSDATRLLSLGFEKLSFCSLFIDNPNLLKNIGSVIGAQSVVITLNVDKKGDSYYLFDHRKKLLTSINLVAALKKIAHIPVGELIIYDVGRDGTYTGLSTELIELVLTNTFLPVTFAGGVSTKQNIMDTFKYINTEFSRPASVAASSTFIFNRGKRNAVLINYPFYPEEKIFNEFR